jgi:hypothetical protein
MNPAGGGAGTEDPWLSSSSPRRLLLAGRETEWGGEGSLAMVETEELEWGL